WGHGFESRSNAIDVQINYLRKRIDRDFEPKLLHTVKGIGYILDDRSAN
ncbi:winged helix-turn-helix domain-containing protein, partial [bacterium]|nr:winged helix-turn-helix domain-containing protein [bacterium]